MVDTDGHTLSFFLLVAFLIGGWGANKYFSLVGVGLFVMVTMYAGGRLQFIKK